MKAKKWLGVSLVIFSLGGGLLLAKITKPVFSFPFSKKTNLKEWQEKILKGRVNYSIIKGEGLKAVSKNSASGIYYEVEYDPNKYPLISWKWRVDKFPKKIEKSGERIDDFAARLYVIFPAFVFVFSKAIEYVWDDKFPPGTILTSPLSDNIKVMVLRKGKSNGWVTEERNVVEDFRRAFKIDKGEKVDEIGAVALMCDTDDSGDSAISFYDDLKVGYNSLKERIPAKEKSESKLERFYNWFNSWFIKH